MREWDCERKRRQPEELFPFTPVGAPNYIRCNVCDDNGWGPALRHEVWDTIKPKPKFVYRRGFVSFLCTACIEKRLGRKIARSDLIDCAMNEFYINKLGE